MHIRNKAFDSLTKEEEYELGKKSQEEKVWAKRGWEGYQDVGEVARLEARNRIILGIYRYLTTVAYSVAKVTRKKDLYEDLIQVGIEKICDRWRNWDPTQTRSYTYFSVVARRAMLTFSRRTDYLIKLPDNPQGKDREYLREKELRAIALVTGNHGYGARYTWTTDSDGLAGDFLENIVLDWRSGTAEEELDHKFLVDRLNEAMVHLKKVEPAYHYVLRQWFWEGKTLEETAEVLNRTRERVRQIRMLAIKDLRAIMNLRHPDDQEIHLEPINTRLRKRRARRGTKRRAALQAEIEAGTGGRQRGGAAVAD